MNDLCKVKCDNWNWLSEF